MKKGEKIPRIKRICKCGKEFEVRPKRIEQGRGEYCSMSCKYKYRVRPKGLVYNLVKDNPTKFKQGDNPWNKGIKTGLIPVNFKHENVGYDALHDWVKRHKEKAICCEHCGHVGYLEWANKSHEYKRDLNDWIALCKRCHIKYDRESGAWGVATQKYNLKNTKKKRK
jgi:hypothetical protein